MAIATDPFLRAEPVKRSVLAVLNPCSHAGQVGGLWDYAADQLERQGARLSIVETRGDGTDVETTTAALYDAQPSTVLAASGDGTLRDIVHALMRGAAAPAPALAILPLGTANNVARALGLQSCRQHGRPAVDLAVRTALYGRARRIDIGQVGEQYFIGSFAAGMDADILALRNRLRRRLGLAYGVGGYPLYLWSCAANLLRRHGGTAQLTIDGVADSGPVYNLLVTNTPLYAGEFRFDAAGTAAADGCLDLRVFTGPADYVRGFVTAWRRHVACTAGQQVTAAPELRRVRALRVEFAAAVAAQIDGEELPAMSSFTLQVLPRALTVRVPPASSGPTVI